MGWPLRSSQGHRRPGRVLVGEKAFKGGGGGRGRSSDPENNFPSQFSPVSILSK